MNTINTYIQPLRVSKHNPLTLKVLFLLLESLPHIIYFRSKKGETRDQSRRTNKHIIHNSPSYQLLVTLNQISFENHLIYTNRVGMNIRPRPALPSVDPEGVDG